MISDSDKDPTFIALYERFFKRLRNRPVRLLELGVAAGGSLRYWAEYFPKGEIVGLDSNPPPIDHPRIRTVRGDQADPAALDACGDVFDIVIDDCSHVAVSTKASFDHLFPRVVPGGIYAIEDWGTGYWSNWPDGASFTPGHDAGMVGFVKSLFDRLSLNDITRGNFEGSSDQKSDIESMTLINGLVVVVKA
jgi:SAM-dependent methyltransferase